MRKFKLTCRRELNRIYQFDIRYADIFQIHGLTISSGYNSFHCKIGRVVTGRE